MIEQVFFDAFARLNFRLTLRQVSQPNTTGEGVYNTVLFGLYNTGILTEIPLGTFFSAKMTSRTPLGRKIRQKRGFDAITPLGQKSDRC